MLFGVISSLGRTQGFGDGPKYCFHYDLAYIYFFLLLDQQIICFTFTFIYFDYILKAIIYFNSWKLQNIYFTIFLP